MPSRQRLLRMGALLGGNAPAVSPAGPSAEASQFFSRITDPGATRKGLYTALIDGIVADGDWSSLIGLCVLAADIKANALVNLKSSAFSPLTELNSPGFVADQGFISDGADAGGMALRTGFTPSSDGGSVFLRDACHIGFYSLTDGSDAAGSEWSFGAVGGGNYSTMSVRNPSAGNQVSHCMSDAGFANAYSTVTDGSGHFILNRSGGSTMEMYRNAGLSPLFSPTTPSVALPTGELVFLALTASGGGACSQRHAAIHWGGNLSAAAARRIALRINTYLSNLPVPANVY